MKEKVYKERDIKRLISQKPIADSCNVFVVENTIEKIYKDVLFDLQRFYFMMIPSSLVNPEQIKWLCEKQENIFSSILPNGIIYYEQLPIGVIYPKYFENYKSFNEIYSEETSILLDNLKKAINKNIELMNNGIYNYDFTMGNILYKEDDVQLIDLDGKYISKRQDIRKVYSYFIVGMLNQIIKKIDLQYDDYGKQLALNELKAILSRIPSNPMNVDYPFVVLQEIEDAQILKR